jgi:predicted Zn-ribbon and HTH transcriptional regulator
MSRPKHEVADIIHRFRADLEKQYDLPVQVKRTLTALQDCRTAKLGGHVAVCTACGVEKISYNSCRNRHCPKCQTVNKERWIIARESELLPVPYYHLVFTLPNCFNEVLPKHAKEVYNALFKASWQTIQLFATDHKFLGAKAGMVSILHTWGQQLWLHPHVHCIVPGGGITKKGKWKSAKYKDKYLFPKRAMSLVFRAKFMELLRQKMEVPQTIAKAAFKQNWVVYAKRPFASPKTVVEYLGRYTHKVAISNHRLLSVSNQQVVFGYKDYRDASKKKVMTLGGTEFLRRFVQHILPHGFIRIRHYGFLASKNKAKELNQAKAEFKQTQWETKHYSWQEIAEEKLDIKPNQCPHCKSNTLKTIKTLEPERGPPKHIKPDLTKW